MLYSSMMAPNGALALTGPMKACIQMYCAFELDLNGFELTAGKELYNG